ncbi:hypothetical protein EVAR_67102_1 [Eumeta japonica]|uniref:Uncharacterized protein n=1 Tax=Eumeta variegata TaxID=151549 RepID=A0A4C1ZXU6_EUMVA|nr:hypothetical protein EVAR_67102_1 [Eumeta japonica]
MSSSFQRTSIHGSQNNDTAMRLASNSKTSCTSTKRGRLESVQEFACGPVGRSICRGCYSGLAPEAESARDRQFFPAPDLIIQSAERA